LCINLLPHRPSSYLVHDETNFRPVIYQLAKGSAAINLRAVHYSAFQMKLIRAYHHYL
jgi:hypothetical protein